jgi:hypothetical protein
MRHYTCDPDAAFDMLRRVSQHRNVKIRHLAAELVEAHRQGRLEPLLNTWFQEHPDFAAAT